MYKLHLHQGVWVSIPLTGDVLICLFVAGRSFCLLPLFLMSFGLTKAGFTIIPIFHLPPFHPWNSQQWFFFDCKEGCLKLVEDVDISIADPSNCMIWYHCIPCSQQVMAVAKLMISAWIFICKLPNMNKSKASCHLMHFWQAAMAAFRLMTLGRIVASNMDANKLKACCHCIPFSQALMTAL